MNETLTPKVLVVGGGPGGYVAAIRCGQLGLDTMLVEGDRLGGTCLIRGCIPSKAMIHVAEKYADMTAAANDSYAGIGLSVAPQIDLGDTVQWKEAIVDKLNAGVSALLKRSKVEVVNGWARFSDAKTCHVETPDGALLIRPEHVILANGSEPVELSNLPFTPDSDDSRRVKVISSEQALALTELPKKLVVVGAGYIGLELGGAFAKLGSKVSFVEAQDSILSQYDVGLVAPIKRLLNDNGVTFHLGTNALNVTGKGLLVEFDDGTTQTLPADVVLVTVGRQPYTRGWGLQQMPVKMAGRFVHVDDQCATSCRNIWAIGDLVGEPMLAHKASAQGEMVAEIIAGKRRRFAPVAIPAICFTDPEIVSVGAGPEHPNTIQGVFPLTANGRALSMGSDLDGCFIRVIADKSSNRIVGVQAVGRHISELSAVFTHAVETGSVLQDVEGIIHAHPTHGEAFHEASLMALGHAIHF